MKRPLTPARAWWKAVYRLQRIARREILAAMTDAMIFGTGGYLVGPDLPDLVQRIDPSTIYFASEDGMVTVGPQNCAPLS